MNFSLTHRGERNDRFFYFPTYKKRRKKSFLRSIQTARRQLFNSKVHRMFHQKSRGEWAENYLMPHGVPLKGGNTSFKDFSEDFYNYSGESATDKKVRGLRISERHCLDRNALLNNHVNPQIGHLKLLAINRAVVKAFRNDMFHKGYSGNTINKCLSVIKNVLESAEEKGLINHIPRFNRAALKVKEFSRCERTKLLSVLHLAKEFSTGDSETKFIEQIEQKISNV